MWERNPAATPSLHHAILYAHIHTQTTPSLHLRTHTHTVMPSREFRKIKVITSEIDEYVDDNFRVVPGALMWCGVCWGWEGGC